MQAGCGAPQLEGQGHVRVKTDLETDCPGLLGPTLPLQGAVTSAKLFNCSEPQFPIWKMGIIMLPTVGKTAILPESLAWP